MSGFTLNGPWPFAGNCAPQFYGGFVFGNATLNLSNTTVSNMINNNANAFGCQQGIGIGVGRSSVGEVGHATVTNVAVSGYQKGGIVYSNTGSDGSVTGSTVTGAGAGSPLAAAVAQNGIQVSFGASATITNNTVTGNACDDTAAGCGADPINGVQSAGILIYDPASITVQGNTLSGNDMGIYHYVTANSSTGPTPSQALGPAKQHTSSVDTQTTGGKRSVSAVPSSPTQITGNTLTNNRYEGIFLDQGNAALSGNTISGGNIGIEAATFSGETGNAFGTLTNNRVTGATVAGVQIQTDGASTNLAGVIGDHNDFSGNTAKGVNNLTANTVTLTNNWWGSASGPKHTSNTFNVATQGVTVSDHVTFVPWLSSINGTPGSFTGASFAPVTTDTPAGSFASIQTAISGATGGKITAAAGTFSESPNITKAIALQSASGRDQTTIALQTGPTYLGSLTISTSNVTVDGFTIKGVDGTASTLAASNIYLTASVNGVTIRNNRLQVGAINDASSNGDDGIGILTTYTVDPSGLSDNLSVTGNIFNPLGSIGGRAFYVNPGVNTFTFQNNQITGNFAATSLTQAKNATLSGNAITGAGAAGSRSAGFGAWGAPDPAVWGHATFTSNTISGTRRGITLYTAQSDTISQNTFDANDTGVWIGLADPSDAQPNAATITLDHNAFNTTNTKGIDNTLTGTVSGTPDWFGSATGPTVAANVGGTGASVSSNVTFSPWCGNAACTVLYGVPTKLVVTTQPANAAALSPFGTQPVVQAQDAAGNLGINFTGAVTAAIGTNPASGVLSGTNPVNAVAGVATFANLSIDKPGTGYTLAFSASALTGATSSAFNVGTPAPTISAISPAVGGTSGQNSVTITGTNFLSGMTVTFGGTAGTNVTVANSTTLTVVVPAHAAGKVDVQVSNGSVTGGTLAQGYEYQTAASAPNTSGRASGPQGVQGVPNSAPTPRSGTTPPPTGR